MAIYALTSQVTTINGVDYSDHLQSSVLTVSAAKLDATDFASGGWEEVFGGRKSGTLALTFLDDVADNDVDEELWALLGTVVAFTVKAAAGATSTSNPEYQGYVLIEAHSIGGGVGELATKSLTFSTSGAITRDVTA